MSELRAAPKSVIHKRPLARLYKGDNIEGQKIACRHTALVPVQVVERDGQLDIVLARCQNCDLWVQIPGLAGDNV